MDMLLKTGRAFYGLCIAVIGIIFIWASTADALGYSGIALMIGCFYTRRANQA